MSHYPTRGERGKTKLLMATDGPLWMASARLFAFAEVMVCQKCLLIVQCIVGGLYGREILATRLLSAMVLLLLVILLQLVDLGGLR